MGIAAALRRTAAARVHMSQFKNNPNFTLYYSDTDSIDIDKPLPPYLIGCDLGQLKLEHISPEKEVIYLALKVYGGITSNSPGLEREIVKVKGLKSPVKFLLRLRRPPGPPARGAPEPEKNEIYSLMVTDRRGEKTINFSGGEPENCNNQFLDTSPIVLH